MVRCLSFRVLVGCWFGGFWLVGGGVGVADEFRWPEERAAVLGALLRVLFEE